MSMNPPAPPPSKKAVALTAAKKEVSRHAEVLVFAAGIILGALVGGLR